LKDGKTDIWMPLYIGDYLADTMHLSTVQHGAYLLLIFHLWRRGSLPDDEAALVKISGLNPQSWRAHRPVLAEFFTVADGVWTHRRVEKERKLSEARKVAAQERGRRGSARRWDASSIDQALLGDSSSSSSSSSSSPIALETKTSAEPQETIRVSKKRGVDARHTPFRGALAEYWALKNLASPEMPWQGRDAKALSDFLSASPSLSETQFRQMLANRARSAVAHGDRVYLWIANLTRYQEPMTVYNKPASAGGGHASRAEIHRDSVVHAVDRALALVRGHAYGVGSARAEPAGFVEHRGFVADGAGLAGCAVGVACRGDPRVETGHAADGKAGGDGSVSYGATATVTGRVVAVGG
jgi:uncharacterized protein YdaU (DUF1376 family)